MDSVIIAAPRKYDAEFRVRLFARWKVSESAAGVWVVEDGNSRVYVSHNEVAREEMDPERLERITARIREPVFYTVDFSDLDLCRRVLVSLADDPELIVDNDHGVLLSGSEFVRVLQSQGHWDWRRDAVP